MRAILLSLLVIALASCGGENPPDTTNQPLELDENTNPALADGDAMPVNPGGNPSGNGPSRGGTTTDGNNGGTTADGNGGTTDGNHIEPTPEEEDEPSEGNTDTGGNTDEGNTDTNPPSGAPKTLTTFGSQAHFDAYIDTLRAAQEREGSVGGALPDGINESQPTSAPADSITNNQEVGVDEGGIVKTIGDYLIVLRHGRLFSVNTKVDNANALVLTDTVNVFPANHSKKTFYDELLVHENKIYVVGYSYGYGATEIGQFTLGDDGKIAHVRTSFLRSNDYYSFRNYASRLVNNKIVFYLPYYFYDRREANPVTFPGQSHLLEDGTQSEWTDLVDGSRVIKPIDDSSNPVLHTIVSCDLATSELTCNATSVVGPYSRTFYVSPHAVYIWNTKTDGASVYRLPLDGSEPKAVLAKGAPIDQFSFKESDVDQSLHVLLRDSGQGDAMWAPEFRQGGVALLSVPLAQFSSEPAIVAEANYAVLEKVEGNQVQNRFIGENVLYGSEKSFSPVANALDTLHVYHLPTKTNSKITLEHDVQRIEALGKNAVVIGSQGNNLVFSSIDLSANEPTLADHYVLENQAQGEQRSHGFFYKAQNETTGWLGLPVRSNGALTELYEPSAKVYYLSVENNHFAPLGSLEGTTTTNDVQCVIESCEDWYGNSRPIFWNDRVFALLGYDIIEGSIANGVISEVRNLDFTPAPTLPVEPVVPGTPTEPVAPTDPVAPVAPVTPAPGQ